MPFTLFKFPTLFGRKQNSYKLDRSDLLPVQLDLDVQDPVILSHTKPSFTTFGYNSEYALEDILKSGFFNDSPENIEKEFPKKNCKKRRPKNPFYVAEHAENKKSASSAIQLDNDIKIYDSSENLSESAAESAEDEKFQELYEELETTGSAVTGDSIGGQFEEIYENLIVGTAELEEDEEAGGVRGSYLPPEIYRLHMESHNQRMGILTKYVEKEEEVYDFWSAGNETQADNRHNTGIEWNTDPVSESLGWCTVDALKWPQSLRVEDRLDFIPSKQTDVIEELRDMKAEETCNSDHFYKVPSALLRPVIYDEACGNQQRRTGEMMPGSESDCDSMDSGLETGNSNLETSEPGFLESEETDSATDSLEKRELSQSPLSLSDLSESIYENAAVLKSASMMTPVTNTIEKYEFGLNDDDDVGGEESVAEVMDTFEAVSFQDLEVFDKPSSQPAKKCWGVRRENLAQSQLQRSLNPTEEKIAKEIRELKEREEELVRVRETQPRPGSSEEEEEDHLSPGTSLHSEQEHSPPAPVSLSLSPNQEEKSEKKFNPSLYRPVILPPRPGIMQNFIANRGKVTAFKKTDTVVQLRKPQVYKSVPKVSPPVGSSVTRQTPGNVLDKIQAELAETKRREDELRRARRDMFRSQPDLSKVGQENTDESPENYSESDVEDDTPSLMHTRGKSALISVWENRIQCEKAA